jgi:hypothetical protein
MHTTVDALSCFGFFTVARPGSEGAMNLKSGEGPWSPEAREEDARRLAEFECARLGAPWDEIQTWMQSWGTPNELPPPKSRKL